MISVELVPAPGATDSASFLSYPYTNEFVNSFIKAWVYANVGDEDDGSFSALGRYGLFDVNVDFRKCLHIITHLDGGTGSLPAQGRIWGCRDRFRSYVGTSIYWISLAHIDVHEFKLVSTPPCRLP